MKLLINFKQKMEGDKTEYTKCLADSLKYLSCNV